MAISIDNQKTRTIEQSPDYPMEFMLGMYERPEAATSKAGSYPKEFVVDISGRASLPMATPQRTRRKILGRRGESAVNMHRWSLVSREIAALGWLLMKSTGGNIESIGLLPIERRASGHGGILVSLLLGAVCQSCALTDVHVHAKPAISAASAVQEAGPLASEFLEAAKLEGSNFAANRIAEQHYLRVALNAWTALKAARDQSDLTLLEIHNQAIANYLQFLSPGDLAIGRADEVVDGRHMKIIVRDEAKPDGPHGPPEFDQLIASERLTIRGFRERYVRAGLGGRLVCQQEANRISALSRYAVPEKPQVARSAVFRTVSFAKGGIEILLVDPSKTQRIELDGRLWEIGGDFSAPFAAIASRTRFIFQRWQGLFRMEHYATRQGIFFLEPYDPEKIPVVMVHGILSSPLMWRDLTNRVMGNAVLQKKYQVWHYTYATGLPILTSAKMFREQLDGVNIALQRAGLPPHKPIVLIGRSLGGLLAKMMVSDSHDLIWNQFFRYLRIG